MFFFESLSVGSKGLQRYVLLTLGRRLSMHRQKFNAEFFVSYINIKVFITIFTKNNQ